jgi:hypothetical protein
MRSIVVVGCLALFGSCRPAARSQETQSAGRLSSERACGVARASWESVGCFAVRCAEEFVRRNGYTLEPATGPISTESVYSPTLEERRGTLLGSAAGYRQHSSGHRVFFKFSSATESHARAVTMNADFDNLRVEHQDFFLSAGGPVPTCR